MGRTPSSPMTGRPRESTRLGTRRIGRVGRSGRARGGPPVGGPPLVTSPRTHRCGEDLVDVSSCVAQWELLSGGRVRGSHTRVRCRGVSSRLQTTGAAQPSPRAGSRADVRGGRRRAAPHPCSGRLAPRRLPRSGHSGRRQSGPLQGPRFRFRSCRPPVHPALGRAIAGAAWVGSSRADLSASSICSSIRPTGHISGRTYLLTAFVDPLLFPGSGGVTISRRSPSITGSLHVAIRDCQLGGLFAPLGVSRNPKFA